MRRVQNTPVDTLMLGLLSPSLGLSASDFEDIMDSDWAELQDSKAFLAFCVMLNHRLLNNPNSPSSEILINLLTDLRGYTYGK